MRFFLGRRMTRKSQADQRDHNGPHRSTSGLMLLRIIGVTLPDGNMMDLLIHPRTTDRHLFHLPPLPDPSSTQIIQPPLPPPHLPLPRPRQNHCDAHKRPRDHRTRCRRKKPEPPQFPTTSRLEHLDTSLTSSFRRPLTKRRTGHPRKRKERDHGEPEGRELKMTKKRGQSTVRVRPRYKRTSTRVACLPRVGVVLYICFFLFFLP